MHNEMINLVTTIKKRNKRGFEETADVVKKEIFAGIRSAGVIEKYEAERAGINVSAIFMVDTDSYKAALFDGRRPDMVEYNEEQYKIYDVRRKGVYKNLEIVCVR